VSIPFVRELDFEYGRCDTVAPGLRRVIAKNPSAFTFHGTGTYIIGQGNVAVVDPGPANEAHVDAILAATSGETITHVLVTHTHTDHSPACRILARHTDAPTYGFGPHGSGKAQEGVVVEEGGDMEFAPDVEVRDGDIIEGDGWSVECVHTPGHTSNHICFSWREGKALLSGDHVMGWSTSIVSPPDGDMTAYLASLSKLLERDESVYWPTHGPAIRNPKPFVQAFIDHRHAREAQILECIEAGVTRIQDMVPRMYKDVSTKLYPAAARSVLAHLEHMVGDGRVACSQAPAVNTEFRLS
jgi:glyoxylase-like metal-dependent hydrolase (beta-lactamase superfamily II)